MAEIMGISARSGERGFGYLDVTALASGNRLRVALHVVAGVRPGPTLLVASTAHGDEIATMLTVKALLRQVDPTALGGTLLVVPVMNPPAFETQTPFTKLDDWSLDEAFPVASAGMLGWARGWATQQLASALAQLVNQVDYVVDLHSGAHNLVSNCVNVMTGNVDGHAAKILELSRAFGLESLYETSAAETTLVDFAARSNIPVITPEFGGGTPLDAQVMADGLRGVFNVMRHVGMLGGSPELPARQRLFRQHRSMRVKHGGMFYPLVDSRALGATVAGGTHLGSVVHPLRLAEVEQITAPYEQSHLLMLRGLYSTVQPGDAAYLVGDAASAETLT